MTGYDREDRTRWVAEDPTRKNAHRTDFARDRARLLHASALRRLANKTQVMSPGSDDFVRNRLTHSLEVGQIGRELGAALGCDGDLVETACLAHDLGHPPFGHNGESALARACADIGGFEGNAQTFRLLTRLEAKRFRPDGRSAGLNLTRAGLDAATKYPWSPAERPGTRKYGVYEDDVEVFTWMREGAPGHRRCLEAQVMDWADDVGYSVHDVEDAVAAGRIDLGVLTREADLEPVLEVAVRLYAPDLIEADVAAAARRVQGAGFVVERSDGSRAALAALKDMTSMLIGRFARAAEDATRERFGDGPLTRYAGDLVVPDATRAECALLKALAAHFVMFRPELEEGRAVERRVVTDLLHVYREDPGLLDPLHREDHARATDDAARLRAVVDQVAGLTDVRAWALHHRWCGEEGAQARRDAAERSGGEPGEWAGGRL
ncbi:deoxyguanosinetriphosphate triphosphohydrolase [Mobilicoccus pelagius]|uniref:deoxyguanosinetriphosphate triphosphohydrolase n=1 Tax=Mobilicoccus pelagius TaxID=746032 RepID=UPI0003054E8B|nr:deoxyguanosinetriphosphate triphosphohydrolase [Mobilicoccus pelagius]